MATAITYMSKLFGSLIILKSGPEAKRRTTGKIIWLLKYNLLMFTCVSCAPIVPLDPTLSGLF